MRALVIQHDHADPAGLVGGRLAEHGYDVDVLRVVPAGRHGDPGVRVRFPAPGGYGVIAAMGAPWSVTDKRIEPWLEPELDLLTAACRQDIPVLGVCFGGQALALALGGSVALAPEPEIGWYWLDTADPALIPAGPWFEYHYDRWEQPPGTRLLAVTAAGPQAFTAGRSLAVQFHPEADPAIMQLWLDNGAAADFRAAGLDPAGVLAETRARAATAGMRARRLTDRFLALAAGS